MLEASQSRAEAPCCRSGSVDEKEDFSLGVDWLNGARAATHRFRALCLLFALAELQADGALQPYDVLDVILVGLAGTARSRRIEGASAIPLLRKVGDEREGR